MILIKNIWSDKIKRDNLLLFILIVFYSVGLVGALSNNANNFLSLTPLNLLLSFVCLLFSLKNLNSKKLLLLSLIGFSGFFIELIGVHTGLLFGKYTYGENLGVKLFEVPLMISVNWILVCFTSSVLFCTLKTSIYIKSFLSALTMTLLDFLTEPVAIRSDFWSWNHGEIPIYNYVCWFSFGFLFCYFLFKFNLVEQNRVSVGLFICMFLFFGILNLL